MKALIDADEVVYAAGFASQHKWYHIYINGEVGDGWLYRKKYKKDILPLLEENEDFVLREEWTYDNERIACHNADEYIRRVVERTSATQKVLLFSGPDNFRKDVATLQPYKGNRVDQEKPKHFEAITNHLRKNHQCTSVNNLEADDLLGIAGYYEWEKSGGNKDVAATVICTKDKDLDMVPGWRYHTGRGTFNWITEREGLETFFIQLLTGDATDHIPGIFKISWGKGKASASLKKDIRNSKDAKEMYAHVWYAYWFNTIFDDECVTRLLSEIGTLLYMKRQYLVERWEEVYEVFGR